MSGRAGVDWGGNSRHYYPGLAFSVACPRLSLLLDDGGAPGNHRGAATAARQTLVDHLVLTGDQLASLKMTFAIGHHAADGAGLFIDKDNLFPGLGLAFDTACLCGKRRLGSQGKAQEATDFTKCHK